MIDIRHSRILEKEEEKKIGNFYIVQKDYYLNSVSRDRMLFIARLKEKCECPNLTHNGSRIINYYFTDYIIFYHNNKQIIPMSKNIPIDAPYTSYFPEIPLLFSCVFYSINLKPLPNKILESIELYSYNKTKDEFTKKTGLPMDVTKYIIPEFISFFPEIKINT